MKKIITSTLTIALLTGCASVPEWKKNAISEDMASKRLSECKIKNYPLVEDFKSDALSVAIALSSRCNADHNSLIAAIGAKNDYPTSIYLDMMEQFQNPAKNAEAYLPYVMSSRNIASSVKDKASTISDKLPDTDIPKAYDGTEGAELEQCAKNAANQLDDDKSDALTIAKAIPPKCAKEIRAYGQATRSALKLKGTDLHTRIDTESTVISGLNDGQPFIRVVLEQRGIRTCLDRKNRTNQDCQGKK